MSSNQGEQNSIESSKSSDEIIFREIKNFKSIEEIKIEAESNKDLPESYHAIYDISPENILLLLYMKLDSKASDNEKVKYFYENMYLIEAEKRKELYEKYSILFKNDINKYPGKCLVQTKKIKEVFKDVLKLLQAEINGNKFYEYLQKDYYIYPIPNYFIPFSEGNEDLIYSYLIIVIYNTFCFEKSKPDEN